MTIPDAFDLLGLDAPKPGEPGPSLSALERAYEGRYNELQLRVQNAQTPRLRRSFEERLVELERAYAVAREQAGLAAGGAKADEEIPWDGPIPGAEPGKASREGDLQKGGHTRAYGSSAVGWVLVAGAARARADYGPWEEAGDGAVRLEVVPGRHVVEAEGVGGARLREVVRVGAGEQEVVEVAGRAVPGTGGPVMEREAAAKLAARRRGQASRERSRARRGHGSSGWTALVVGGALAVGVAAWVWSSDEGDSGPASQAVAAVADDARERGDDGAERVDASADGLAQAAGREAEAVREPATREPVDREAPGREVAEREALDREVAEREAEADREAAEREALVQAAERSGMPAEYVEALRTLPLTAILNLQGKSLRSLPPSLGQMTNLRELNLNGNALTGLPANTNQLTKLERLYLSDNALTSVPSSVWQLTNLRHLSLGDNALTGIPSGIGRLTSLEVLSLNNAEVASLPLGIGQLRNLRRLYLDGNALQNVPQGICQLTNLYRLHLDDNALADLPWDIGQLTNLRELHLNDNRLESLPSSIGQLENLRELHLNGNALTSLPTSIGQLTNLQELYLRGNRLSQSERARIRSLLPHVSRVLF